jgi:2-dehydro-3-deoxyphosphooctonate aldolase (KDO 8-P synthase)
MSLSSPAATREARIGEIRVGANHPLALLAGPCVVEDDATTRRIAARVVEMARAAGIPVVFKASFDKANRTSASSFRGPGIEAALKTLATIKRELRVPIVTDIHAPDQAAVAAEVADLLQIPAFLCRQTDLLLAAAKTGRAVNVKKGQWISPDEMKHVVAKLRGGGAREILLTERGTFFGYHRLVNDMTAIPLMQAHGVPVVFDATHSVQRPGAGDGRTDGDRRLAPGLARAAVAAGADLVFMEVHEDPDRALSDGPNSLRLETLPKLFAALKRLREQALADPPFGELHAETDG